MHHIGTKNKLSTTKLNLTREQELQKPHFTISSFNLIIFNALKQIDRAGTLLHGNKHLYGTDTNKLIIHITTQFISLGMLILIMQTENSAR
jgi:hypothetical protein